MNVRDPLNLRSTNSQALEYLRGGAATFQQRAVQASRRIVSTVQDTSKKFDDYLDEDRPVHSRSPRETASEAHGTAMSYALPSSGPTQRHQSTVTSNGSAQGASDMAGAIGEKMSSVFGGSDRKASLPMYKDKPYQYPTSSRQVPWFRRRRLLALLLVFLVGTSWWFGLFSWSKSASRATKEETPGTEVTRKPIPEIKQEPERKSWLSGGKVDWNSRAESVKSAFRLSWLDYEKHAWGFDEYHPKTKSSRQMTPEGLGWIIVDALDTLMLMNLTDELTHARQWLSNHTYDQNHDVNTFETTIRMVGGLLSAHYLSTSGFAPVSDEFSDDMYIEKAVDLADRLLGAYKSQSGVPFASINLHTRQGIPSHADQGASSTAEATTLQLEMKYLAKETGETVYWQKAEHVMKVIDDNNAHDGLVPIFVSADRGTFQQQNIRLGSRGDSYYEYLIKQYLQTNEQEPVYQAMWNESLAGVKKHLLTYSKPSNFLVLGERPNGLMGAISPKVDHLVCFMPGTIALAATGGATLAQARKQPGWGAKQEEEMEIAAELMKTCWGMYKVNPTGLAGEISHFNIYDPPKMYEDFTDKTRPKSPEDFKPSNHLDSTDDYVGKEDYIVKSGDRHNLQRPETVESLFYMWRITGDEKYRNWGWEMFNSFVVYTAIEDGSAFSSLNDVTKIPPVFRDNMESFWLAETLKYFYLLFSSNDVLPLTDVVFNTEAHPFPRFSMGKLFSTGWQRKPRDAEGNLLNPTVPDQHAEDFATDHLTATVVLSETTQTPVAAGATATAHQEPALAVPTGFEQLPVVDATVPTT